MNILLKKLVLRNFKGQKDLTVNFGLETNIYGENATGKSTIFDAFTWLLFGKDTTGRSDFEMKTLDKNGNSIHRLEHEVYGLFEIDGMEVELRRIYKEKWIKKRGELEAEYAGNTEDFFYNDVPLSKSDYAAKISAILDENIFRLITNPLYFNSLKWQDRRQTLLNIAGEISNADILQSVSGRDITLLMQSLNSGKTIDEFKREIGAKKKKIKDELEMIPARIDEQNRSLPDSQNWAALQEQIAEKQGKLESIEAQLLSQSKALQANQSQRNELLKQIDALSEKQTHIRSKIREKVVSEQADKNGENLLNLQKKSAINRQKSLLVEEFMNNNTLKESLKSKKDQLTVEWKRGNEKKLVINEDEFICPTCKRELDAADIDAKREEMTVHFNEFKKKTLDEIASEGKLIKKRIESIELQNENIKLRIAEFDTEFLKLDDLIKDFEKLNANQLSADDITTIRCNANEEFQVLKKNEKELAEQIATMPEYEADTELLKRKKSLQEIIYDLRDKLSAKERIDKIDARVEELKQQERELAGELAHQEGIEFTIQQFMKAKMETLERRINDKFAIVKFKLFETQINGGEVECCETLINGVPFQDCNHAGQLNSGLDIINVLSNHYEVTAPIFVDNAESTNEFIKTNSQFIKLIVSKDKDLRIEVNN